MKRITSLFQITRLRWTSFPKIPCRLRGESAPDFQGRLAAYAAAGLEYRTIILDAR
jgi:hypothetical protein